MNKEALYEKIEAYLNGALTEAEHLAFEAEIAAKPELAQAVQLHREITQTLGDSEKIAFRKTIQDLRQEITAAGSSTAAPSTTPSPEKDRLHSGFYLLGLALLLGLLYLAFKLSQAGEDTPPLQPIPNMEVPAPSPTAPNKSPSSSPPLVTAPKENMAPVGTPARALVPDSEKSTKPLGAAAAEEKKSAQAAPGSKSLPKRQDGRSVFDPIPVVEAELNKEADPVYSVESGVLSLSEKRNKASYDIRFNGLLLTAMEQPELALVLFDNRIPITEITAVIPVNLQLAKQDPNIRAFAAKKAYEMRANYGLELQPGLYYLRLQRAGDMGVLWTGKVVVKE